jgi:hypothetical protein
MVVSSSYYNIVAPEIGGANPTVAVFGLWR